MPIGPDGAPERVTMMPTASGDNATGDDNGANDNDADDDDWCI